MGVFYPQSVQYVDEVAILNNNNIIPNTIQQPLPSSYIQNIQNHYVPYPTPEDTLIFDPSFVHPFEAFLEENLIMDELEDQLQQVTETRSGSGLSEETVLKHLRVYKVQGNNNISEADSCCICLDGYEENEKMGILDCGHRYHVECIKRWLLSNNVCPMCRSTALTV
ncbi:hypothetical protein SSX86_026793 [Deinandra increscens subsp. villosa]|uniref:RING-type E3 ubiquitin transferase n=1 Tax=Deinandra increscens subsp. villosa TaxID=3103831 RepID=A0AAP0GMI3_9ASTR